VDRREREGYAGGVGEGNGREGGKFNEKWRGREEGDKVQR